MANKIIMKFVLVLFSVCAYTSSFATITPVSWKSGKGTLEKPYLIESAEHLYYLSKQVKDGENYEGVFFRMTKDIDLQGNAQNPWIPIGDNSFPFKGHFSGNNFEIINLYIDNSSLSYVGLFGYVHSGSVERLGIAACGQLSGKDNTGAIVGYLMGGTISHCCNKATVKGNNNVGGIVGHQYQSTVSACYNMGSITGYWHVGGITGMGYGKSVIENCYNMGKISANNYKGGIAGKIDGYNQKAIIKSCYQESTMDKTGVLGVGVSVESTHCYYADVSGMTPCQYGILLSREQMQTDSFLRLLDNNQQIWQEDKSPYVNSRYPVLASMKYEGLFANEATDISQTKASLHASFVGNKKAIIRKGFEYKVQNDDEYIQVFVDDDSFSLELEKLATATIYIFRAFVETDKGMLRGREVEFRTLLEKCGPNCGHHHHDHDHDHDHEEHRIIRK